VALIGPPNSGKSTLFNQLTGLRQKVANYPGVTVEKHLGMARLPGGGQVTLIDLPGVNGFAARSLDERVTRDVLEGRVEGLPAPDALIVIVDTTRLETQLMVVEPVLHLRLPTLLVLNIADELERRSGEVNEAALAAQLGVGVVRANARAGIGVDAVRDFLSKIAAGTGSPPGITLPAPGSGSGPALPVPAGGAAVLPTTDQERPAEERRTIAPSRDAGDPGASAGVSGVADATGSGRRLKLPVAVLETYVERREHARELGRRAGFRAPSPSRLTERIDAVALHRVWGPLVFVVIVALVFQSIFAGAAPLMDGVESLISTSGEWLSDRLPGGWLHSLLIDGVWQGVGAVLVFLPQILVLFLFLGILEDSGYMARAAVIADRLMYRVGLQGRAFLPLLSAYACAVPAILAARTVEDERDRLATIFVAPFMTCSARLPVYALLIAAFIPERPLLGPLFGTRAATLLGLYVLGAVAAIVTAFVIKRTLLRGSSATFLMELPPYRLPTLRSLGIRLLDRSRIFLYRVGRIILLVAIVLWVLTQFPRVDGSAPPLEDSALGRAGQLIEPAIEPLGFDWKIGVGLISSLMAREVIVGTLGTIYGVQDAGEGSLALQDALRRDLTFGGAVALLLFFAFALQCTSTIAVMRRETAGWKWPAIQWSYMLLLAYGSAFVAYRLLG
jgi:ferrous iron transport protein B